MLARDTITAALPVDIRRMADWYVSLRRESFAALVVLPSVDSATFRAMQRDGTVVPDDLLRWETCRRVCREIASYLAVWPRPMDWPSNWLQVYAGENEPIADEYTGGERRVSGRKR